MKLITFELQGKFAHFRKYFGNNTALSYALPPRTTLMGILGVILGRKRDSYYEELASEHIRIGIGIIEPVKKSFQRLNNLKVLGSNDFRGQKGHVQTPYEMVTPYNLRTGLVRYQVFLSAFDSGINSLNELQDKLTGQTFRYNLSLGPAFCHGQLANIKFYTQDEWQSYQVEDELVSLNSTAPSTMINSIAPLEEKRLLIEEEMLPCDFVNEVKRLRELKSLQSVLFTTSGHPLKVNLTGIYHSCESEKGLLNFTFLEKN